MPGIGGDFTSGLNTGANLFQQLIAPRIQQAQLQQQWQQHLNNLAIQQQQQERLAQAEARNAELHPWKRLFEQTRAENESKKYSPEKQKLETDAIRAKIDELNSRAAKNRDTAPALTPEEKRAQRISEFREKEKIKGENKRNADLTELTPASRTKYQEIVREVNSIMPVMKELVEQGGEKFTGFKSANDLKYLGKITRIADVYMKAKGWPNTREARHDAIELFKRGFNESPEQYKTRMEDMQNELLHEAGLATSALEGGKVKSSEGAAQKQSNESNEKIYNPVTRSWE